MNVRVDFLSVMCAWCWHRSEQRSSEALTREDGVGMTSAQHSEEGMRVYRLAVAELAYDAHCLDYYAKITADVKCGSRKAYDQGDKWQRSANGWTVTLRNGRRSLVVDYWTGSAITDEPTAADVLSSVLLDASLGQETFEDFAANLGCDTDSRRAYASWLECKAQVARLDKFEPEWRTLFDGCDDPSTFDQDDDGNVIVRA